MPAPLRTLTRETEHSPALRRSCSGWNTWLFNVLSYLNSIYHRASRSWSADLSFKKWEEEEAMSEDHELKGAWHADNHQEGIQRNHRACWKGPAGKIVRNGRREAAPRSCVVNLDFQLRNSRILTLGHSLWTAFSAPAETTQNHSRHLCSVEKVIRWSWEVWSWLPLMFRHTEVLCIRSESRHRRLCSLPSPHSHPNWMRPF